MLESFYLFLLMAGAIQGIVMGILLWRTSSSPQWKANQFLALILFFFAYRLLAETLVGLQLGGFDHWMYHVLLEYNWIYGSLIYCYILALIQPDFQLSGKNWLLFLPVLIEFIWSNFIKSQNFFWDGTRESLSWLGYWGYIVWMHTPFQIVIGTGLVLYYTWTLKKRMLQENSDKTTVLKTTVKTRIYWILYSYIGFSLLVIGISLVDYFFFDFAFNPKYIYPTFIGMALLTYGLGVQGIWYRNEIIFEKTKKIPANREALKQIIQQLEKIMATQKPYLQAELTVATLAKYIDVKPYQLTKALNLELGKKFNGYINEYRVTEVKILLNNPTYDNKTLLAIAFDAGFNSKASFNRVVKKITGQSPSSLKKSNSVDD